MADEPDIDFTEINIKHTTTGEVRQVAKHAFDAGFWPDYERVDTLGRAVATPKNTDKGKES